MFDPLVLDSRNVVMQRLSDALGHGYTHFCTGTVAIGQALRFVAKMASLYYVAEDRHAKSRAKRCGRGSAMLLLARYGEATDITFWLLVTPPDQGTHPAHHLEVLLDALLPASRIELDGYELVRHIRGTLSREPTRPSWTWRMQADKYLAWRASIVQVIRHRGNKAKAKALIFSLFGTAPGFAGARKQVGKLTALYRKEWSRRRGNEEMPPLPSRLGYVRRLPNLGQRLHALISAEQATQERLM